MTISAESEKTFQALWAAVDSYAARQLFSHVWEVLKGDQPAAPAAPAAPAETVEDLDAQIAALLARKAEKMAAAGQASSSQSGSQTN